MIRVKYEKLGDISYVSHLDMVKLMERISRRAGIRLAFSQGYSPHPKTAFSPALSVGMQSYCEYIDLELEDETIDLDELLRRYNQASVEGIRFTKAKLFTEKVKSIVAFLTNSKFEFEIDDEADFSKIEKAVEDIKKSDTIMLTRTSKSGNEIEYDMKEMINEISCDSENKKIIATIFTSSEKNLNPRTLLEYIFEKSATAMDTFYVITKLDTFNMDKDSNITRAI